MTHSNQDTKIPDGVIMGAPDATRCPTCQSLDIHPSQSLYPMDVARLQGHEGGFWRCRYCGDRFIGPQAPPGATSAHATHGHHRPGRHHGHGHRHEEGRHRRRGANSARWIFPILIALAAIIAMVFFLDGRGQP